MGSVCNLYPNALLDCETFGAQAAGGPHPDHCLAIYRSLGPVPLSLARHSVNEHINDVLLIFELAGKQLSVRQSSPCGGSCRPGEEGRLENVCCLWRPGHPEVACREVKKKLLDCPRLRTNRQENYTDCVGVQLNLPYGC